MKETYTLTLPAGHVSVILAALAEQQYKQVAPVMNTILAQTDAQEQAAADTAALAAPPQTSPPPVIATPMQTPPAQQTDIAAAVTQQ